MVTIYTEGAQVTVTDTAPVVEPPPPPPVDSWPRRAPDMLNIDLVDQDSLLKAKWLDGNPGYDGKGGAIHYGDMAGPVDNWNPFTIPGKLSNGSMPPTWGVEANGLHYLAHGMDGSKEPAGSGTGTGGCATCRVINWMVQRFSATELYLRFMLWVGADALTSQRDLGIKLSGLTGHMVNGGTFAEIFELGRLNPGDTSWPLQVYRYDAEAPNSGILIMPGIRIEPERWYTMEEHIRVPSAPGAKDGLMEFKVDGDLVFARSDVNMNVTAVTMCQIQIYHGGTTAPSGPMHFRTARVALSRGGWIGPAPEVA